MLHSRNGAITTMRTIYLRGLIDLVAGDVAGSETRIQTIFEWRFDREMNIAKWALGLAASLTIGVLIAFFRGGPSIALRRRHGCAAIGGGRAAHPTPAARGRESAHKT